MCTCPNCSAGTFTAFWHTQLWHFHLAQSHTPTNLSALSTIGWEQWLFIYYLQRKNPTTSCSLIIDMFELDEVQSHTPSLSSSLQAVCLCVRPLGRLGVCVVCQSRQQTELSSQRSLLLEHFLFCPCWTSGYQWKHTQLSYATFCSWTWKGEIFNFLLRNLILQIVGLSLIWQHSLNNFSSCVKEYPIKTGNIVYAFLVKGFTRQHQK